MTTKPGVQLCSLEFTIAKKFQTNTFVPECSWSPEVLLRQGNTNLELIEEEYGYSPAGPHIFRPGGFEMRLEKLTS